MPHLMRMFVIAGGLVCAGLIPATGAYADDVDIFEYRPETPKQEFFGFDDEPKPLPPRYLDQRWDRDGNLIGTCMGRTRATLMALTYVDTSDPDEMEVYGPGLEDLEKSARAGMKRAQDAYNQRLRVLRQHKIHLSNFLAGYVEGEQKGYSTVYRLSRDTMSSLVKGGLKDLQRCNTIKVVL